MASAGHPPTRSVWLCGRFIEGTGNAVTAKRLANGINSAGRGQSFSAKLVATGDIAATVGNAGTTMPSLVIGIHAIHGGLPVARARLLDSVPLIVLLSGTDINLTEEDSVERLVIVAKRSSAVVSVSQPLSLRFDVLAAKLGLPQRCTYIAQGVDVSPWPTVAEIPSIPRFSLRAVLALSPDRPLWLLPASIRKVKDPCFLVETLVAQNCLWEARRRPCLVIVGVVLDDELMRMLLAMPGVRSVRSFASCAEAGAHARDASCRDSTDNMAGPSVVTSLPEDAVVVVHPVVDRAALLHWITECDAVVNTSVSEGQSNVVLEAMALGKPVVVRGNEGNRAVVDHNATGFVFAPDSPGQAVRQLAHICGLPHGHGGDSRECEALADAKEVASAARMYVTDHHGAPAELASWLQVIDGVLYSASSRNPSGATATVTPDV